jgi:hypothetical protein
MNKPTSTFTTLIFLHVPHTGGTSLRDVIRRQYQLEQVFEAYDRSPHSIEDYIALPEEEKRRIRCFMSHLVCGLHHFVPGEAVYYMMLRDPVKRALSDYTRIMTRPNYHMHDRYQREGTTFEQHFDKQYSINIQLKQLLEPEDPARLALVRGRKRLPEDAVDIAKRRLESFPVIGLTERFDESLLLLQDVFGWQDVRYIRQNVSTTTVELPDHAQALVAERCALEIEVYQHACALFEAQVQAKGPAFQDRLVAFREENQRFQQQSLRIEALKERVRPVTRHIRRLLKRSST